MLLIRKLRYWFNILFVVTRSIAVMFKYSEYTIAEHFRKQGAKVGKNCIIAINSLGGEPYLVSIGNHVHISRDVIFHTHDGGAWICKEEVPGIENYGKIIIEDNCLIGAGSHLLPNIRIGRDSIIGAGSVVITDVPQGSVVMGVPARIIGSSQKYREKCIAIWNKQKLPDFTRVEMGRFYFMDKACRENEEKLSKHLMRILDEDNNVTSPP